jgi:ferredoxin, 2Fe-2S
LAQLSHSRFAWAPWARLDAEFVMPTLTILPSGKTAEINTGTRLLDAILAAGENIVVKCGGNASCGACHVFIQEGHKAINRLTPLENAKLDTMVGVSSKSRLACQVTMGGEPVTVELLGALSG